MADYVASQTVSLDDQVSAGAADATAALSKLADAADSASSSADNLTATVTKAGASATALANRFDPATKAANDLAKAQADLAINSATMDVAVANGSKTQAQADAVTANLTARVRAAQAAVDQYGASAGQAAKAASGMSDANSEAANSANVASGAHAGLYREIVILGHEVITGNFSRIPGSLVVLAERSGQLENIFSGLTSLFTTMGGAAILAGAAGALAIGAIGIEASNAIASNIALQNSLRVTRDDYVAMASEVQAAARAASLETPGLSGADALSAGGIIGSNPDFSGSINQLKALIEVAANVGVAFHETADKAATDLAAAMEAPGVAADKLVGHLQGMTQALADSIKAQADAGDKAGAFARYEDVLAAATDGAAQHLSPLRQAMRDVAEAFDGGSESGKGFGSSVSEFCIGVVYSLIEALTGLLLAMNKIYDLAKTVGNSVMSSATGDVPSTIDSVGSYLNAPKAVVDLAHGIQPYESSTGMYNAQGQLQVSSAGAIGAMQVMPGNANGNDLTSLQGNVTAAEQLLIEYYNKYDGNLQLVAMAYNWGPANVDKYLAGQQSVPQSVQTYAANVTAKLPAGDAAGNGVVNTQQDIIDGALKAASGSTEAQAESALAKINAIKAGMATLDAQGLSHNTGEWAKLSTALDAAELQYSNLAEPAIKVADALDRQISSQDDLTDAYGKSYAAAADVTAHTQAVAEAMTTVGEKSQYYAGTVEILTQKHLALAQATAATQVAQETLANGDTLQYLQAETSSLGTNVTARDAMLAHLKAEQELRQKNISDLSAEGQAYLASVDKISAATAAYQQQQQTMGELENFASGAFDTISNAITQAFATGGKAAINFGSIALSVLSSVLSEVLKLAVLNPVLNSLFGGNKTTIGDVGGLIGGALGNSSSSSSSGGGSSSTSNASSALGDFGTLSTVYKAADWILGGTLTDSVINGVSGLFGGATASGVSGLEAAGLVTPLSDLTPSALAASDNVATASSWFGGAASSSGAQAGASTALGSIAGYLPYIGAALGVVIDLATGNYRGAGLVAGGAAVGAAVGSIFPVVGTAIGLAIGAAIGGLIDTFFPQHKENPYVAVDIKGNGSGQLVRGDTVSQIDNPAGAEAAANKFIAGVNALDKALNIGVAGSGIVGSIGQGVKEALGQTLNPSTIFKNIRFTPDTTATTLGLAESYDFKGQSFANPAALVDEITKLAAFSDGLDSLGIKLGSLTKGITNIQIASVTGTSDSALALQQGLVGQTFATETDFTNAVQKIEQALQGLYDQNTATQIAFDSASGGTGTNAKTSADTIQFNASAQSQVANLAASWDAVFGPAYASMTEYQTALKLLGATIAEQAANLAYADAAAKQNALDSSNSSVISSITAGWKAQASIATDQGGVNNVAFARALNEDADLANFDASAQTQRDAFMQGLVNTYGVAFQTSQAYATDVTNLDASLAEQRLAIQAQYAAQAKAQQATAEQAASSALTSLTSYAQSLETGATSPLNAKSQYALEQSQFDKIAQQAAGGNTTAIGELQQYASAFLSSSQNLYGSGAQYATDFADVLSALQAVAAIPQSALTADFLAATIQDQTDILAANQQAMLMELASIRLELSQQNSRPN